MTARVSAVGCIGLLGGDAASKERGARPSHYQTAARRPAELHHAPHATRNSFLREDTARKLFRCQVREKPPNARHHPPPRDIAKDEIIRVGGRVHAVVGLPVIETNLPDFLL